MQGEEIGMVDGFVSWEDTVDPSGCNTDDPINYWQSSRDPERTPFQWSAETNAGKIVFVFFRTKTPQFCFIPITKFYVKCMLN